METEKTQNMAGGTLAHKIGTVIGVIMCVILIPILIVNCTLLVKSQINSDAVPDVGGYLPMIVLSDSMTPEINEGDLIICHQVDADDVEVGDVISFFDPAGNGTSVVTHRVEKISEDENGNLVWITKGDANNAEDDTAVPYDALVGKWTGVHFAKLGNVAMFMQTSTGLVVCIVIPLFLLVGYDILRRRLFDKKNTEDTEKLMEELAELRKERAGQTAEAVENVLPDNHDSDSLATQED